MKNYLYFLPHFWIFKFSAKTRLILLLVWGLLLSIFTNIPSLFFIGLMIFISLIELIRHNRRLCIQYGKKLLLLNTFVLMIWLTMSWKLTSEGIQLNQQGITLAWLISLKMNILLGSVWLLLWQITDTILLHTINSLPLPKKLSYLFILTLRYISLFSTTYQQLHRAMLARGYQPKFNFRTFIVIIQQVTLLLVKALDKVEKSEMALKSRGFKL